MEKCFYHPSRGCWQTLSDPSQEVRSNYPSGTVEIPLRPSPLHTFDGTKWVEPTQADLDAAAAHAVRSTRNMKLVTEIDPILMNPLRWGDLNPAEQAAIAAYRQELLDVPQQAGFPKTHTWPNKP